MSSRLGLRPAPERPQSPEYVSQEARRIERQAPPILRRDESIDAFVRGSNPGDMYLQPGIEALSLESLIVATVPPDGQQDYIKRALPPLPDCPVAQVQDEPRRYALVESVAPAFDKTPIAPFVVTPIPRRPLNRRNAVSYRAKREAPLRVVAVRRAQQEEYARALQERFIKEQQALSGHRTLRICNPDITPDQAPKAEPIAAPKPKRQPLRRARSSLSVIPEEQAMRPVAPQARRMLARDKTPVAQKEHNVFDEAFNAH